MYITIRRYETDPGAVDEMIKRIKDEFVPIISKVHGFIDYYLLSSTEQSMGVVTSVSMFRDEAGADESDRVAAEWVHRRLAALAPNPPQMTSGEASFHAKSVVR